MHIPSPPSCLSATACCTQCAVAKNSAFVFLAASLPPPHARCPDDKTTFPPPGQSGGWRDEVTSARRELPHSTAAQRCEGPGTQRILLLLLPLEQQRSWVRAARLAELWDSGDQGRAAVAGRRCTPKGCEEAPCLAQGDAFLHPLGLGKQ